MSWSARRQGCIRGRWPDTSREPRGRNNGCRRAAGSRCWPMVADRAQQPAEEGFDLLAARPLGGTKHGSDEAALAVEHDDRLKSVFVVMGVEQPQLLAAMDRVERVVDVEGDPFGNLVE